MKPKVSQQISVGWAIASLLYGALFLIILQLAYTGNLPPILAKIPYSDKIGHIFLYGIATYLGQRMFNFRAIVLLNCRLPLWATLFSLFTIVEEGIQLLSPNRTFSGIDLVCSLAGIALGYWLAGPRSPKLEAEE